MKIKRIMSIILLVGLLTVGVQSALASEETYTELLPAADGDFIGGGIMPTEQAIEFKAPDGPGAKPQLPGKQGNKIGQIIKERQIIKTVHEQRRKLLHQIVLNDQKIFDLTVDNWEASNQDALTVIKDYRNQVKESWNSFRKLKEECRGLLEELGEALRQKDWNKVKTISQTLIKKEVNANQVLIDILKLQKDVLITLKPNVVTE